MAGEYNVIDNSIRILNKDDYEKWDELVCGSTQGTVFHSIDWISTASKLLNKKPLLIGEFREESLIGGCILYINDHYVYRTATTILPLSPYGGFLIKDLDTKSVRRKEQRAFSTINHISAKLLSLGLDNIIITNSYGLQDIRPFIRNGWNSEIRYTYILSLTKNIEMNFSTDARREIKKARKAEIGINKNYNTDVFWNLTSKMYERQNLAPPFNKTYLEGLMNILIEKKIGEMWIAETSSAEPASALFIAMDDKMAHGWTAANNPNLRDVGATTTILYEAARDIYERGFKKLNLMAGNTSRLSTFYTSFNPDLIPYFEVKKSSLKGNISKIFQGLGSKFK